MNPAELARFRSKLKRGEGGCILWQGSCDQDGYGQVKLRGKTKRTHRVIWEHLHGRIPKGLYVLHLCDEPGCCNPDHLALGTPKSNTWDKVLKGRQR